MRYWINIWLNHIYDEVLLFRLCCLNLDWLIVDKTDHVWLTCDMIGKECRLRTVDIFKKLGLGVRNNLPTNEDDLSFSFVEEIVSSDFDVMFRCCLKVSLQPASKLRFYFNCLLLFLSNLSCFIWWMDRDDRLFGAFSCRVGRFPRAGTGPGRETVLRFSDRPRKSPVHFEGIL